MNLNQLFVGDVELMNISGYIHRGHVTDEYIGVGGWGVGLTGGHIYYIHWLTNEYMGPRGHPRLTRGPLTDEYKRFIFYYCVFWLPPRMGSLQNSQTIQHFTHNNNMTDNSNITHISSNPQYSSRQAKKFNNYIVHDKRNKNRNYGK
jgi:hypothetical protein